MNHAIAGRDGKELWAASLRGDIDGDWCVDPSNGCIDWKQRLGEGQEPRDQRELDNLESWTTRYKDLRTRWEQNTSTPTDPTATTDPTTS